jgi:hypothetical protein
MSYRGFLAELLPGECDDRARRRSERRITAAKFPARSPYTASTSRPTPSRGQPPGDRVQVAAQAVGEQPLEPVGRDDADRVGRHGSVASPWPSVGVEFFLVDQPAVEDLEDLVAGGGGAGGQRASRLAMKASRSARVAASIFSSRISSYGGRLLPVCCPAPSPALWAEVRVWRRGRIEVSNLADGQQPSVARSSQVRAWT